jgi:glutamyl/glutaminyl-tRNA synthetase
MSKLSDFLDLARFCFYDDIGYSEETADIIKNNLSKEIAFLIERLRLVDTFSKEATELAFRKAADDLGLKAKILVHPARVALTGKKNGPGLFESMEVLGKEKVLTRLGKLLSRWNA